MDITNYRDKRRSFRRLLRWGGFFGLSILLIVVTLLLVLVGTKERLATWALRQRLVEFGMEDLQVEIQSLSLARAVTGPVRLGSDGPSADQIRVEYTLSPSGSGTVSRIFCTGIVLPIYKDGETWRFPGLDSLLTGDSSEPTTMVIPMITLDGGTLVIHNGDATIRVPFTATATTRDGSTYHIELTLVSAGDTIKIDLIINSDHGTGSAQLVAMGIHPERHLEMLHGVGLEAPPLAMSGLLDVKASGEFGPNWSPIAGELHMNGPRLLITARSPIEDLTDAGVLIDSIHGEAIWKKADDTLACRVTADSFSASISLAEALPMLERQVKAELKGAVFSAQISTPEANVMQARLAIDKLQLSSGNNAATFSNSIISADAVPGAPNDYRAEISSHLLEAVMEPFRVTPATAESTLRAVHESGRWRLTAGELHAVEGKDSALTIREFTGETQSGAISEGTFSLVADIDQLNRDPYRVGKGRINLKFANGMVELDTVDLPIELPDKLAATLTTSGLQVDTEKWRLAAGVAEASVTKAQLGSVWLAPCRIQVEAQRINDQESIRLAMDSLTIHAPKGTSLSTGNLEFIAANDFSWHDVDWQRQLRVLPLKLAVRNIQAGTASSGISVLELKVYGDLGGLTLSAAEISLTGVKEMAADAELHLNPFDLLASTDGEIRLHLRDVHTDPAKSWNLMSKEKDVILHFQAAPKADADNRFELTLLTPPVDSGDSQPPITLQSTAGTMQCKPILSGNLYQASDGRLYCRLKAGLEDIQFTNGQKRISDGHFLLEATIAGLTAKSPVAALPDSASCQLTVSAKEIIGFYGLGGAASAALGLSLSRKGDVPRIELALSSRAGKLEAADWTLSELNCSIDAGIELPPDSTPAAPVGWGDWLAAATPDNWVIGGKLEAGTNDIATEGIRVRGIHLNVPFAWSIAAGLLPRTTADAFVSGRGKIGKIDLQPASWPVSLAGREAVIKGTLSSAILEAGVDQTTTIRLFPTPSILSIFKIAPTDLDPRRSAVEILAEQTIETLTGNVSAEGEFRLDASGAACTSTVTLASISYSDGRSRVGNVNGSIRFDDLLAWRTAPSQKITFEVASVGPMFFGDVVSPDAAKPPRPGGTILFRIDSPDTYFLESCDLLFLGGRMQTHAVRFDPGKGRLDLTLYGDDLRMQELLGLINGVQGQTDAKLFAKLVITYTGKTFDFGDGYIYLLPGQDEKLRLTELSGAIGAQLDGLKGANPRLGLATDALKNLALRDFKVTLSGDPTDKTRIRLRLRGSGPTPINDDVPVDLKLNVGGDILQYLYFGTQLDKFNLGGPKP